ncbi:MAG: anti-sigma factor family protein [Planctomycetota bacterium]
MKCEDLLKMLNDYVDGDIDPSICDEFQRHLEGCDPCKVVVDTVRKTITLYRDAEVYEIPLDFRNRLHAVIREKWEEKKG